MKTIKIYDGLILVRTIRRFFKTNRDAIEYANSVIKPGQTWTIS